MRALLSVIGHVKGDSTLALGLVQDSVHCVQQCHLSVHVSNLVFIELEIIVYLKMKTLASTILILFRRTKLRLSPYSVFLLLFKEPIVK